MPRDFGPDVRASRAREMWWLVGVVILGLALRLGYLQLVRGDDYRRLSEENRIRPLLLRAERGRIMDRYGVILADNDPSYRLSFDFRDRALRVNSPERSRVIGILADILDRDPDALEAEIRRRSRGPSPMFLSRKLTFAQTSQIEERIDRLPGVDVEVEPVRRYPHGRLACHVLGHLGEISDIELDRMAGRGYRMGDLIGRTGLERQYESDLRGSHGLAFVEVDAHGRRTGIFPDLPVRPAVPGHDLVLTLDAVLQRQAEAALAAIPPFGQAYPTGQDLPVYLTSRPEEEPRASLVAMDPVTGEILAMASSPRFDPNLFVQGLSTEDWLLVNAPNHPMLNRAVQSAYPPGSVFKIFTSVAGLEAGVITEDRLLSPCTGGYRFGGRTYRCWRKEGHGRLALSEALARSCNVYYYQVGIALGVERIGWWAGQLGLAERTGIDLPEERAGFVPTAEWYVRRSGGYVPPGAALNLAIGQGEVLLTPLQLASFMAALSTRGRRMRPHLLRKVVSVDGTVTRDARAESWEAGSLPLSPDTYDILLPAMERVVMERIGTGTRAQVGPFRIAGKTGTAQNPHGEDGSVFVCFATMEDARIAVAVVAEERGSGGATAAPVAQRVLHSFLTRSLPEAEVPVWIVVEGEGD